MNPPFDIGQFDGHVVIIDGHRSVRRGLQFPDEARVEAAALELEMLEGLGVRQAPGPVMAEDIGVFGHDFPARGALGLGKAVANDLEDQVVRGHIEDRHDHTRFAGGDLKDIPAGVLVARQIPVELGFAVPVEPQGNIELGQAPVGQQGLQKSDQFPETFRLDMEVGVGVAEQQTEPLRGVDDAVDPDTLGVGDEGDGQGVDGSLGGHRPSDQVSAHAPEKGCGQHVHVVDAGRLCRVGGRRRGVRGNICRHAPGVALQILKMAGQRRLAQNGVADCLQGAPGGGKPQKIQPLLGVG